MKAITSLKEGSCLAWSPNSLPFRSLILSIFILTGMLIPTKAQEIQYVRPTWYFGAAAGANINFYRGSTQVLNSALTVPTAFHNGNGVGLYFAPLLEFHRADARWGGMLQVGYDNRKGTFKEVSTPCNCPADLATNLSYFTVEPSLRLAPFKSDFYLYAGPRFAFNLNKSFTYSQDINPAYPDQTPVPDVKGNFNNVNNTLVSMQVGAGYDIQLSPENKQTQYVLSPFVSFQPYFGQSPRSVETWNNTTLRLGAALKFGHRKEVAGPVKEVEVILPVKEVVAPKVNFTVLSPENIPIERRVRETFPVRNYVFFDLGSTEIPDRYVLLKKDQVMDFKEDQLEVFKPKRLSGRSAREMAVYYNVLNILGDRMGKNPNAVVRLTGASMEGSDEGLVMAERVKSYLVDIFGINPARIKTEGRVKPRIASEQPGDSRELVLLREGDRRVSIFSESPALLMEFQSGPDSPLKPVELLSVQEAPIDSYVTFTAEGASEAFKYWSLEIVDDKGIMQQFGPYTTDKISIPGKSILGSRPEGNFKASMIGYSKDDKKVKKEVPFHMVLWVPSVREEGMRYSVIYEYNDSKAIAIYEKYLTEVVTPKIPVDGTVIIHGYTDIIGQEADNLNLSLARANDVRGILERALAKAGRSDVQFEVYGFGEDESLTPFENKYPEERFYNRTVILDLIPKK